MVWSLLMMMNFLLSFLINVLIFFVLENVVGSCFVWKLVGCEVFVFVVYFVVVFSVEVEFVLLLDIVFCEVFNVCVFFVL